VSERFDDLLDGVDDPAERERLLRVHRLLLAADPPPDLSRTAQHAPAAAPPRRQRVRPLALLAAALAAAAFGGGYFVGDREPTPERVIEMAGVGAETDARASIRLLAEDEAENWPMDVLVRGLEPSRGRDDFYELWLTKDGKPYASCGRFLVGDGLTRVTLTVPYGLRRYDGWIVTRAGSKEALLTT
jgi:Anti-sigma-K factor rskA